MNVHKRTTHLNAKDLAPIVQRARRDWEGIQIIAIDDGRPRFELLMTWDDRESAVARTRWALGFDRAAIGHRTLNGGFTVLDMFERRHSAGIVTVRHIDLVQDTEGSERLLVPPDHLEALGLGMIHVRDYDALVRAQETVATGGRSLAGHGGDVTAPRQRIADALAVIARIEAKWAGRAPRSKRGGDVEGAA